MKYYKNIMLLITLLIWSTVFAQSNIEYENKALTKALQKYEINYSDFSTLEGPDSITSKHSINGKYFVNNSNSVSHIEYIYVGRVNSCRAGGCSAPSNSTVNKETMEYFDYFILFDKNMAVQQVKVYNYKASHGHEVTVKGWLKQFIGYNGSESLTVDKDIDSISGATISVYAITYDIESKSKLLRMLL